MFRKAIRRCEDRTAMGKPKAAKVAVNVSRERMRKPYSEAAAFEVLH